MKPSARNVPKGKAVGIGPAAASSITRDAMAEPGLVAGDAAVAAIKASDVMAGKP